MEKRQNSDLNRLQFVWPRAAVLQVIQLWRRKECLYNPKHQLYHSKFARHDALVKMTHALRKNYPEITPAEVKNKITYLRGQYTRELARIKEKSNGTSGDVYKPSVFWYSDMEFLGNFTKIGKSFSKSNEQSSVQTDDDSCESSPKFECDESPFQDCKRSRLDSSTPVSNQSMSQETLLLLPRNSAPLFKGDNDISERDEAFCNYIKMEISEIKNKNIKDDLIEKIMIAVLDAKKEQKLNDNDFGKCFEDV